MNRYSYNHDYRRLDLWANRVSLPVMEFPKVIAPLRQVRFLDVPQSVIRMWQGNTPVPLNDHQVIYPNGVVVNEPL